MSAILSLPQCVENAIIDGVPYLPDFFHWTAHLAHKTTAWIRERKFPELSVRIFDLSDIWWDVTVMKFGRINIETTWWRHQMKTFSALLELCGVDRWFPSQRPVKRSFFLWSTHEQTVEQTIATPVNNGFILYLMITKTRVTSCKHHGVKYYRQIDWWCTDCIIGCVITVRPITRF